MISPSSSPDYVLLANIGRDLPVLEALLATCDDEWVGEDMVYRFWHQSFKVYGLQEMTVRIADALNALAPVGTSLHPWFVEILAAGTGRKFDLSHNEDWTRHTRPIVEAFFHARFLLAMAVRYGRELDAPPSLLPSGWAALLTLYGIR